MTAAATVARAMGDLIAGAVADLVPVPGLEVLDLLGFLADLEDLDDALAAARVAVADARARLIADHAAATSSRQAAADLALSVAAVAKAQARTRALILSGGGVPHG